MFNAVLIDFDQIYFFLLKSNFSSPEAKILHKYFKIKATPIWPFNLFTNDSPWKVARRQLRFLASPGEEVTGVIL